MYMYIHKRIATTAIITTHSIRTRAYAAILEDTDARTAKQLSRPRNDAAVVIDADLRKCTLTQSLCQAYWYIHALTRTCITH